NNASPGKALSFTVSGTIAGATVSILIDGNVVGSATAAGSTTSVLTNGTAALLDGSHSVTATQTAPFKVSSSASGALSITSDTTAPTVSPLTFNFDTTQSLVYSFSE